MAVRKSVAQVAKDAVGKKYFASENGFKKKTNFGVGSEVYIIPLDVQNGVFTGMYHDVQPKAKGKGLRNNQYTSSVKCTKETGTCKGCELATAMYEKFPKTGDESKDLLQAKKRIISFSKERVWIPVMILGNSEKDASKKVAPNKVSIKTYDFSYLEMSNKQYKEDFIAPLLNKLKDDGIVEYDLTEEEQMEEASRYLSEVVIRVRGVESSFKGRAKKEYSYIPFSVKALGASTDEHDNIVNYMEDKEIMNSVTDFITLFSAEVENLLMDVGAEELEKYVLEASERNENIEQFKQATAEQEEEELAKEEYTQEQFDEEIKAVDEALTLGDDDITFDTDDDFLDEDAFAEV